MPKELATTFAALSDPTRLAIVTRLMQGEATVQQLAAPFDISQPAISRHLQVLEEAGLIETRIVGTSRPRRLKPEAMRDLWDWLGEYRALWQERYARLDEVLASLSDETDRTPSDNPERSPT